MHARLLIINEAEIHLDSYFEMLMLYCCRRLLYWKDKGDKMCTFTTISNILQHKHHKVNIVIIPQQ